MSYQNYGAVRRGSVFCCTKCTWIHGVLHVKVHETLRREFAGLGRFTFTSCRGLGIRTENVFKKDYMQCVKNDFLQVLVYTAFGKCCTKCT